MKTKPTIKEFAQNFAIAGFLTDVPEDLTFDEVIAILRSGEDNDSITVTQRYEIDSTDDVADMIVDMASDLEQAFMRVHDGEFIVGEEKNDVKFFSLKAKDHSNTPMTIYLKYVGWNDSVNDDDVIARMEDGGINFDDIKTFNSPEIITEETFKDIATEHGHIDILYVNKED